MGEALSDDELATFRKQCADIEELGWATVPDTVYRLIATIDVQAARLAAAERVVEAALGELAAIAQYDPRWTGAHVNDAPGRQKIIERAYDAWVALSAPPTDRGADGG